VAGPPNRAIPHPRDEATAGLRRADARRM